MQAVAGAQSISDSSEAPAAQDPRDPWIPSPYSIDDGGVLRPGHSLEALLASIMETKGSISVMARDAAYKASVSVEEDFATFPVNEDQLDLIPFFFALKSTRTSTIPDSHPVVTPETEEQWVSGARGRWAAPPGPIDSTPPITADSRRCST